MSRLETNTDTIIALRGFVSNALAFRLPASQFATFHALEQAAYAAFDIEPDAFTLHLHLRRREEGSCERQDGRYVLDETGWEHGVDVGGEQGVWAHFVIRDSRRRPRRALNQDATTVYPLCMPISKQRYADTRYFARETVFIPVPGAGARKVSFGIISTEGRS
ncbi:hypothetical protein DE146DRAFT_192698 [Phaeosphaeria sp. MPI-PUGE-AT-0046c]|nr:hypothetical protein DE146DRAFT_192698 [Phaeosphaeria sp. MPI-PUGE-AT-0046c]